MKNQTNGNGALHMSRKWKLILLVLILATVGAFLPPLVSAWLLGAEKPLILLSGIEWVSVVTLSVSAYFGANVIQKHVEKRTTIDPVASGVAGPVGTDTSVVADDDDDKDKEA